MERVSSARRRGALDVAMIGLMRDARLRVSEAAALTWGDIEQVSGGFRSRAVWEAGYRVVSAETMRLLSSVRRGAEDDGPVLGLKTQPDSVDDRRGGQTGGIGRGLFVKGGEKVFHCGGGIVYHRHDEKELNWEPGGVRSGAGVRRSGLSQESSGSSETW